MFSTRHYQAVADVINDAVNNMEQPDTREVFLNGKNAGIEEIAHTLADMFAHDNERFSRTTFLAACDLSPSV
jgi:hypothetical protein